MCNYSDPTIPQVPSKGHPWQTPHSHIPAPQDRHLGNAGTQNAASGAPRDLGHCWHHALGPGGSSHGTVSKCDVLCHCTTEDFTCCVVLPVPALQGALLCSEYIYSLQRSEENSTSQIFFFWLLSIFLDPLSVFRLTCAEVICSHV